MDNQTPARSLSAASGHIGSGAADFAPPASDNLDAQGNAIVGNGNGNGNGHGHGTGDELRTIIPLPDQCSLSDAVHFLSRTIPANEFGLPVYFLRSDLLGAALSGPYITQEDVDAASVGLFYTDGYPTLPTGSSFWSQLPHEPKIAHLAFTKYLEQGELDGIRQLDTLFIELSNDPRFSTILDAHQNQYQNAGATHADTDADYEDEDDDVGSTKLEGSGYGLGLQGLVSLYRQYYWSSRARAYDLFVVAAEQKRREHRIRKMENRHFIQAEQMFEQLLEKFQDPEWIEELNAKEAIEALETLVKIQRLSVGLTGQHASSNAGNVTAGRKGVTAEYIMRQVAQGTASTSGEGADRFTNKLQALLADPSQGMLIQEAILKLSH